MGFGWHPIYGTYKSHVWNQQPAIDSPLFRRIPPLGKWTKIHRLTEAMSWKISAWCFQWIEVFTGKSSPETIDFPIKIMGFSGFNFPFNQSIDGWATPLKNHGEKVSWDDDIPNMMGKKGKSKSHVPKHQPDMVCSGHWTSNYLSTGTIPRKRMKMDPQKSQQHLSLKLALKEMFSKPRFLIWVIGAAFLQTLVDTNSWL